MWNRGMFSNACTDTQEEDDEEEEAAKLEKGHAAQKWQEAAVPSRQMLNARLMCDF